MRSALPSILGGYPAVHVVVAGPACEALGNKSADCFRILQPQGLAEHLVFGEDFFRAVDTGFVLDACAVLIPSLL